MTPARVVPGIAFVLFASAVFAAPPAGKLYKWVDEKGVVHYTQTIPADVNQKSNTVLDRRGRVVQKQNAAFDFGQPRGADQACHHGQVASP